ncbi:MAG: (deoxy)nucleoside triphosphate pyrophosphohydrolase [Clostridia bacterium]|nr:(deoxy)nucleoside triphosphate pyrophosphohydrolase [Clostridia bacterium]
MIEVVAALIKSEDSRRFLLCQRPGHKARGGQWEFLGGKVEVGETKAQALVRECREEIGVTIAPLEEIIGVTHEYPDLTVHLTLIAAQIVSGEVTLHEHQDARWVNAAQAQGFDLCPADRELLHLIRDRLP